MVGREKDLAAVVVVRVVVAVMVMIFDVSGVAELCGVWELSEGLLL